MTNRLLLSMRVWGWKTQKSIVLQIPNSNYLDDFSLVVFFIVLLKYFKLLLMRSVFLFASYEKLTRDLSACSLL